MQKYIDNLDDFEDDSRPPILDWVEWLVPRIIAAGGDYVDTVDMRVAGGTVRGGEGDETG